MVAAANGAKGLWVVLLERGLVRHCDNMVMVCNSWKTETATNTDRYCCTKLLSSQPDFKAQMIWIQEVLDRHGCLTQSSNANLILVGSHLKNTLCRECSFSFPDLKAKLPAAIEAFPNSMTRRMYKHCLKYMAEGTHAWLCLISRTPHSACNMYQEHLKAKKAEKNRSDKALVASTHKKQYVLMIIPPLQRAVPSVTSHGRWSSAYIGRKTIIFLVSVYVQPIPLSLPQSGSSSIVMTSLSAPADFEEGPELILVLEEAHRLFLYNHDGSVLPFLA